MAEKVRSEALPNVLVYGIEQVGIDQPTRPISTALVKMDFESFDTDKKFHDYDGVIVFQSTFEKVEVPRDLYGDKYYDVKCKSDELIPRFISTIPTSIVSHSVRLGLLPTSAGQNFEHFLGSTGQRPLILRTITSGLRRTLK